MASSRLLWSLTQWRVDSSDLARQEGAGEVDVGHLLVSVPVGEIDRVDPRCRHEHRHPRNRNERGNENGIEGVWETVR